MKATPNTARHLTPRRIAMLCLTACALALGGSEPLPRYGGASVGVTTTSHQTLAEKCQKEQVLNGRPPSTRSITIFPLDCGPNLLYLGVCPQRRATTTQNQGLCVAQERSVARSSKAQPTPIARPFTVSPGPLRETSSSLSPFGNERRGQSRKL